MSLSAHLLIRITLVGLLCWLGVTAAVVGRLQREGQDAVAAQADRLTELTELQLRRQLVAQEAGSRIPDLARVAAAFGRHACLRYKGYDVSFTVSWGCDMPPDVPAAPRWLDRWLDETGALPRELSRIVTLWSVRDGTLTVVPARSAVIEGLWLRLRDLAGLTAATIIAVNILVVLALRRLLRPTDAVLGALDRLAQGDLATGPQPRGPHEFRRILHGIDALRETLALLTAQRSALTARLIDSQEAERRDLARDLHDEMGQGLAALQAVSGGIRMSAQVQDPARAEDTDALDDTIAQLHAGLRALLGRLRPPLLESQGLDFALRELIDGWNARQRAARAPSAPVLRAQLRLQGWPAPLPEALGLGLYRATQEALTNARRYASAREPVHVDITCDAAAGTLALRVHNVRAGTTTAPQGSGLGLRMMAERISSLGGTLRTLEPTADTFELHASWPLAPRERPTTS